MEVRESRGATDDRPLPGAPPAGRRRATALLIALRFGYAYNWFDIGPALVTSRGIGAEFGVGPGVWGLLVGAFLVGAGASQVPAGLLARRHGERPIALGGAGLLAVAALAGAFSPSLDVLLASRVVAGVGAGLFFSPAIGWVGRLFGPGERGVPVGTFSSAFSAGAAAGVVGSALLVPAFGWRTSLVVGAVGLGLTTLVALLAIPTGPGPAPPRAAEPLGRAWRGRSVVAIGLAFVGFEGATFATGQFVVPFGESVHAWAPWLAGAVGAAFVLPSVLGGPVGGVVAERSMRHRTQFVAITLLGAAALAALPLAGLAAAIAIGATFSFAYGFAYAVMYVVPHFWPELPAREIPLAIGLFNAMQLGGGALVSALFGLVVAARSYALAWEVAAVLQVATLAALVALRPTGAGRPRAGAVAAPMRSRDR